MLTLNLYVCSVGAGAGAASAILKYSVLVSSGGVLGCRPGQGGEEDKMETKLDKVRCGAIEGSKGVSFVGEALLEVKTRRESSSY